MVFGKYFSKMVIYFDIFKYIESQLVKYFFS